MEEVQDFINELNQLWSKLTMGFRLFVLVIIIGIILLCIKPFMNNPENPGKYDGNALKINPVTGILE